MIEIEGKTYPLRASMLAIQEAEEKSGVKLNKIEGLPDTATFLWYCAKHAALKDGEKWHLSLNAWLDMIELHEMQKLTDSLNQLIGNKATDEGGKKKGEQ